MAAAFKFDFVTAGQAGTQPIREKTGARRVDDADASGRYVRISSAIIDRELRGASCGGWASGVGIAIADRAQNRLILRECSSTAQCQCRGAIAGGDWAALRDSHAQHILGVVSVDKCHCRADEVRVVAVGHRDASRDRSGGISLL